jgi:DNA-binding transcriptional ArsR family regulator
MGAKPSNAKDILDLLMGAQEGEGSQDENKSLDAFAILSLPAKLRKTAMEIHRLGRVTAAMISEVTGESEESENFHLKELSELGYLLREEIDGFIFFSLNRI